MPAAGIRLRSTDNKATVANSRASAALTLSTTPTDVTGLSVTLTTINTNVKVIVTAVVDARCTTVSGTTAIIGQLVVDAGSAESGQAIFVATASGQRATIAQTWLVTLGTAGSHTIKVQGSKNAAVGTYSIEGTHSAISVFVADVAA